MRPCPRALFPVLLAVLAAGCFRDRDAPEVTEAERAAYAAPADSSLTPDQVDRYLQTMLAQFELVAAEAPARRAAIVAADTAGDPPMKRWSDFLASTYVRAARRVDANPAEMEFVGERMQAVGRYLATRESQAQGATLGAVLREQAEGMRGVPGSEAQVAMLLQSAEQAENQVVPPPDPRLRQNLDVLARERRNVTDAMWGRIARVSGGVGLMALGDMADTTATGVVAQLDDLSAVFQAALENRAY